MSPAAGGGDHASVSGAGAIVLAIETSCDDTSVAVLEGGTRLRSHLIAAQDIHRLYGGVVPELASRAHLELLPAMVKRALAEAEVDAGGLTGIAVTHAPGLVGSLVVGIAFAKAYAAALGLPLVGVNHIEAHLHSASLEHGDSPWPAVALVVSGGHTELVEVRGLGDYHWLGATLDDAAGEAYDKGAKRLGLGFPGGGRGPRRRVPVPAADARPARARLLVLGAQDRRDQRPRPPRRAAVPRLAGPERRRFLPGGGRGHPGRQVRPGPRGDSRPGAQPGRRRGV